MSTSRLTTSALALILSCALFAAWLGPGDTSENAKSDPSINDTSLPPLRGDEAVASLKQQGLYDSLQQAMAATRYRISLDESRSKDSKVAYRAPNPAQGFDALFTQQGMTIQPRAAANQAAQSACWQTAVSLVGYGYKNDFVTLAAPALEAQDDRIELSHESIDGTDRPVTEWYVNKAEGLEQGFVIHAQPGNKAEGERLRIAMKLSGDLKAEIVNDGQAISFSAQTGTEALRYEKLHVTDAAGRMLAAQMRVEEGELWLEVEDDGATYPLTIDPTFAQQAKLTASDGAQDDRFGQSVSISGETAVIGAPFDDTTAGTDAGSAYVFVRAGSSWTEQAHLTASDAAPSDNFGWSVSINGETIIIGAYLDDTSAGTDAGSAYVFVRTGTTWTEQAHLTASDAAPSDNFSHSVAISGETAVVSAQADDTSGGEDAGSAYVFIRTGSSWTEQAHLTASDGAGHDIFGYSVAISGETVVVGAPFDITALATGSAYVFVRTGTTWTEQAHLTTVPAAAFDEFGHSVAISGGTIVVGAPRFNIFGGGGTDAGAAFVFVRTGSSWSQQAQLKASDGAPFAIFGQSVSISGETVVIGAPFDDTSTLQDAGSAYLFVRAGGSWSQQAQFIASDAAMADAFGQSVSISEETIVVGAYLDNTSAGTDAGSVYVFACSDSTTWTQQAKVEALDGASSDFFGISVSLSGETAVVGSFLDNTSAGTGAGSAYVFVRTGTTWTQQAKLTANDAAPSDRFGISVAISGETIVVGAFLDDTSAGTNAGSAYVFVRTGATWTQQAKLTANDGDPEDRFGGTVAISGETVVVGDFDDDLPAGQNVGSAYVFVRTGTTWNQQAKLTASDGAADDQFGNVSISGETIAVGAPIHSTRPDFSGFHAGAIYVFVRSGATWTQQAKLTASDGTTSDVLGWSISISGETIVGGATNHSTSAGTNAGAAYVFVRTGTTWTEQAKLTASYGAASDFFGQSVGISGNNIVVGSRLSNTSAGPEAGAAYIFSRAGATWTQQAKIIASEGVDMDQFGWSAAISGKTALVGTQPLNGRTGYVCIFNAGCVAVPTAVELSTFTASAYDNGISLEWSTGFEASNLGFNLYRDDGGKRYGVNSSLIAGSALLVGSGTRLSAGRSYGWWGNSTADLKKTRYWLEAVDLDGASQWYGPVTVKFVGGLAPDRSRAALLAGRGYLQSGITAPLSRSAPPPTPAQSQRAIDADLSALAAIKVAVKTEGFYRVSQAELLRAGLDPKVDPRFLQLFVDGQQLPVSITGEQDGRLDANDALEFYAVGLDTASTDARIHWLVTGSEFGLRIATVDGSGSPTASASFPYTVERKDRTVYFSSLLNGERENFFGPVVTSAPVDQSLSLRHIATKSTAHAQLEIALQGVTKVPHNVQIWLNGSNVGAVAFSDQSAGIARLNVPQSMLKEGDNRVSLMAVGGSSDVSLVDYVRLTYGHLFTAESNLLRFTSQANRQFTVDGFTNDRIRVLDVTDINRVQEVRATIKPAKNGYSVSATPTGEGERRLVAFANEQARFASEVRANQPSRLRQPSNGADLIIITRPQFASSLAPLVALRQKQGLAVTVVDAEDIYDEFSFGQKSPQSVKDFLAYASSSWKRKPSFVLFGGDASLDPRNYLGLGDWDFVPSRLIDTQYMETVSDDWAADTDGDGLADLAAGRLPFRTVTEAERIVSKIIRYETGPASDSVLIASDRSDEYSFEEASAGLKSLIPANIRVEEVRRGQMGDAEAKSKLIEAINRGQKIVNYTGHGSVDMWRAGLLTSADVAKLSNEDRLSLFVMMTCLNGYFQDASLDSLAESLIKADRGGAVAVWASSGMTVPNGQAVINQELYRLIFGPGGQSLRLGEATRRAKAAVGDTDIRRSWILFGDPTMKLR